MTRLGRLPQTGARPWFRSSGLGTSLHVAMEAAWIFAEAKFIGWRMLVVAPTDAKGGGGTAGTLAVACVCWRGPGRHLSRPWSDLYSMPIRS